MGTLMIEQLPWDLNDPRTIVALVVVGVLAFLFLTGLLFQGMRQQAAAIMTSIGILGTFVGIYVAMPQDFTTDTTRSAGELLDGMKTALLTSLMGLGSAVLFRVFIAFGWHREAPSSTAEDSVLSTLTDIRTAIAGKDDEGHESLANQIGQLRVNITGRLDRLLVVQANGFGKLNALTETIRETLVENLQKLIADLNESVGIEFRESMNRLIQDIEKALIDQFGKTFVEFNEATQALKEWQEDHRSQVEQLTTAFNTAATSIETIARNCERIPPTMDRLYEGLSMARQDVEALNRQLEVFADLRKQAEQFLPTIKQNFDSIGDDLANSAAGLSGMKDVIEDAFKRADESAKRTMDTHAADVVKMTASMRSSVQDAQNEALSIIKSSMGQFSEQVQQRMKDVAESWGREMVAIAEACGDAIAAVQSGRRGFGPGSRGQR